MDTMISLRVFCLVAELKSFAAAGKRLNLSPAMVSKHVIHLENRIGIRLLNRTSRHVSLTEPGALYFAQAKSTLDGLDEVEAAISNVAVSPRGTLRLSAPVWTANTCFVSMLAEYNRRHPDVSLDMDLSGRIVNLVDEGFDLALRAMTRDRLDSGLVARPLMQVEFRLVGSPHYLKRMGRPKDFTELNGHALLRYSGVSIGENLGLDGPNGQQKISLRTVMLSENETVLHLAALQGMGLAFLPLWMVEADLAARRLELVLPDILRFGNTLHAVYPSRKYLSAKVRTFIDFLASQIPEDDQGTPLPSALNLLSR
ncbi:LysR family transcriptional regulator [Mitsuaria sp. TWR114]|uniref:LysR family transcriptional regulator n=1 Tax=unclassified Roseateles TaxID=2626991 RepID=UPI000B87DDE7|nr:MULTISPECIES: LysR family transcriptional regulator [unclassified Roseateles]TXD91664.1 LysR family transcriptional regulator [Mitsuaria sp. TWR114]